MRLVAVWLRCKTHEISISDALWFDQRNRRTRISSRLESDCARRRTNSLNSQLRLREALPVKRLFALSKTGMSNPPDKADSYTVSIPRPILSHRPMNLAPSANDR